MSLEIVSSELGEYMDRKSLTEKYGKLTEGEWDYFLQMFEKDVEDELKHKMIDLVDDNINEIINSREDE